MRQPRIGIVGSYGGLNLGDEAILASMLTALRGRLPDARFTVFSRDADHTRAHHAVDAVVAAREVTREEATAELMPLDLLLLGGGGILYDSEARIYLRLTQLAQALEVPTMTYAVGAGPLSFEEDRRMIRSTLPRMAAVTVRDKASKRILEHCDLRCPIEITADPALLLDPLPVDGGELGASGIPTGRRLFGMSLREPGHAAPDLDEAAYQAVLAYAADFACSRFDAEVVFIPMEAGDLRLSHAVIGRMVRADRAHVLKGGLEPRGLLRLMSRLDMLVAMRLHVMIFGVLAGTPVVALPYAPKVSDLAAALDVPTAPPASADCVGALLAALDHAWDVRGRDADRLGAAIDMIRAQARRTADIAVSCIEAAAPSPQRMAG